jgi:hypothetical protein
VQLLRNTPVGHATRAKWRPFIPVCSANQTISFVPVRPCPTARPTRPVPAAQHSPAATPTPAYARGQAFAAFGSSPHMTGETVPASENVPAVARYKYRGHSIWLGNRHDQTHTHLQPLSTAWPRLVSWLVHAGASNMTLSLVHPRVVWLFTYLANILSSRRNRNGALAGTLELAQCQPVPRACTAVAKVRGVLSPPPAGASCSVGRPDMSHRVTRRTRSPTGPSADTTDGQPTDRNPAHRPPQTWTGRHRTMPRRGTRRGNETVCVCASVFVVPFTAYPWLAARWVPP